MHYGIAGEVVGMVVLGTTSSQNPLHFRCIGWQLALGPLVDYDDGSTVVKFIQATQVGV